MQAKELSESQTELIIQWVKSHHLSIRSLENEFIDHICCDVELLMKNGKSFKAAFECLRNDLGNDILPGLEKQTLLKLNYNQRFMKFMTRLAGIVVLLSFFAAIVTRFIAIDYWKTLMAGGMVVLGLGFAPLFFLEHYRKQEVKGQKVLHIFGFLAAFLIPMSAFMGLFNSPHAITVMAVGILFLLLGFIPLSWLSVSKGSGRTTITGSIIFLLFFVLMSYGFLGVRISKDRVENWIFLSHSSDRSASALKNINSGYLLGMKKESGLLTLATEIENKSDKLVQNLSELRDGFILEISPVYKTGDLFFKGMDSNFAGKKLLIDNGATDQVLKETGEYETWLISILSEENVQVKEKISRLLNIDFAGEHPDYNSKKNYLFRDFPAIADVSVINSMILNVRIAEYQTLNFLNKKESSNY
jgi:hypothetical protein